MPAEAFPETLFFTFMGIAIVGFGIWTISFLKYVSLVKKKNLSTQIYEYLYIVGAILFLFGVLNVILNIIELTNILLFNALISALIALPLGYTEVFLLRYIGKQTQKRLEKQES